MKKVLFFPPTHVSPLPVLLDMPDAAAAALVAAGAGAYPLQLPGDVPPVSTFPLSISGTPAAGMVGSGDTFTPTITGGTPPYSLSVASGTLPGGRSIAGLAVTGSYTTAGSFSYTLRATDNAGATADLAVTQTVAAAVASILAMGTGGRQATDFQTVSATKFRDRSRSITRAAGSPYVTFAYPLWYIDNNGVTQTVRLPDGLTARCQFDVYTNGTISNAAGDRTAAGTVNGASTFTVATGEAAASTGGSLPFLYCRLDMTGIPVGAAILCMLEMDALATGWFMTMTDPTSSSTSGENVYYGGTTSIGTFGAMTANGGSSQTRSLRPIVIFGEPTSGAMEPVAAIGDSNTAGKNPSGGRPGQDGSTALSGMAAYGLWLATQPYSVLGKNGDRMVWWNNAPANDPRFFALRWFKRILLNHGTNDLSDTTSATDTNASEALKAAARSLRPKLKAALAGGTGKIGQGYILPRVTNTGGFTDAASQNVQTGYRNTDAARPAYDAAIAADVGATGMALDFTFDPRSLVNDPAATDKWKTDGATAHYYESDGTHLTQLGAQTAAPAYRDAVSA